MMQRKSTRALENLIVDTYLKEKQEEEAKKKQLEEEEEQYRKMLTYQKGT